MPPNVSTAFSFIGWIMRQIMTIELPWGIKYGSVFFLVLGFPTMIWLLRFLFGEGRGESTNTAGKADKIINIKTGIRKKE